MKTTNRLVKGEFVASFQIREYQGYDLSISDEKMLDEIFVENVYRLNDEMISEKIVIDLGANIGAFSIYAKLLRAKKIYAYEPQTENYNLMINNIKKNKMENDIKAFKLGVFGDEGKYKLVNGQTASSIVGVKVISKEKQIIANKQKREIIETITLEQVFKNNKIEHCGFLKIDTEGSEFETILNTPKYIMEKIDFIAIENHKTDAETYGKFLAKISETHSIQLIGNYLTGGMVYANKK